jgi:carboxylate-amine ligase
MLTFKENKNALTLGVEMELQVLDKDSLQLVPRASEIMEKIPGNKLAKEMFRSTIELVTGICSTVSEISADLRNTVSQVREVGHQLGLRFAGTGAHPIADYTDRIVSVGQRYHELLARNQWIIRRMAVYGLHIHIGMRNGDECIRFNNFFLRFVPHFIALSGSSPFWRGHDTGLSSVRPTMYESQPISGMPTYTKDWESFIALYNALLQTGSIQSMKDIWWDLRPSPGYGTLELRMCDGTATIGELEAITAFAHMLAHWFDDNGSDYFHSHAYQPERWILRENKWRVIRFGTDAELIDHDTLEVKSFRLIMLDWLEKLKPYSEKLGYFQHFQRLLKILHQGNSSVRQRAILDPTKDHTPSGISEESLQKVLKLNVQEMEVE